MCSLAFFCSNLGSIEKPQGPTGGSESHDGRHDVKSPVWDQGTMVREEDPGQPRKPRRAASVRCPLPQPTREGLRRSTTTIRALLTKPTSSPSEQQTDRVPNGGQVQIEDRAFIRQLSFTAVKRRLLFAKPETKSVFIRLSYRVNWSIS
jgi:hypothetical protein